MEFSRGVCKGLVACRDTAWKFFFDLDNNEQTK